MSPYLFDINFDIAEKSIGATALSN